MTPNNYHYVNQDYFYSNNYQECNRSYYELRQIHRKADNSKDANSGDNNYYYCYNDLTGWSEHPPDDCGSTSSILTIYENTAQDIQLPDQRYRRSFLSSMADKNALYEFIDVYLDLGVKGLGMKIKGGIDSPDKFGNTEIYVSEILNDGVVYKDGRLQIGDKIVEVNGNSLKNVSHKQAVECIIKSSPYLHFHVKRLNTSDNSVDTISIQDLEDITDNEPLLKDDKQDSDNYNGTNKEYSNCVYVELIRNESGFGFSIIGGLDNSVELNNTKLYVNKIVQNGPAHKNGQIQIGDEIVAINDINLERVPYNWAINTIRNSPAFSVFTVRKNIYWE